MRVSIIIPAYNEENYIEGALQALNKYKPNDIEIIVVNNGSTDKTVKKVSNFPNVKLIHENRRGVQFARERGRLEARGRIIANLDADCIPGENWIKSALKYLEDERVIAVSGPYEYHDGNLFFRITSFLTQKIFYNQASKFFYFLFGRGVVTMGGNIFIRAEALQAIGGYDTRISFYGDDTDTGNRLVVLGKVLYKN